jgi:hypothetical protein
MNNPINVWENELNKQLSKSKNGLNMKSCSISLPMQVKITLGFYLPAVRRTIIKKKKTANAGRDAGENEPL